ncbi:MAG TPA: glutathione transferase [Burkholderiaceae bacterium]|nr:glutathione transferase [Burkholderiaceae bacterium]
MPPSDLVLYVDAQFASPYAMSVFVALQEKRCHVEMRPLDLSAGAHHEPGFAARSLTRRVPTLVDGDFALSESTAILEYLDESLPGPRLYPADVRARARARQLQAWLRSDLLPLRQERSTEVLFYGPTTAALSPAATSASERLFAALDSVLPPRQDFLFGRWSIADVDVALMLNRLVLNGDPVPRRLADYATLQWQRPSVQAWVRQPRPPR